jgi:hypothetical protein
MGTLVDEMLTGLVMLVMLSCIVNGNVMWHYLVTWNNNLCGIKYLTLFGGVMFRSFMHHD